MAAGKAGLRTLEGGGNGTLGGIGAVVGPNIGRKNLEGSRECGRKINSESPEIGQVVGKETG